jgi:hypothetical protein
MKIDKLQPILCFAFQFSDATFPVLIDFGGGLPLERAVLSKQEIFNLSRWEEVISIVIEDVKGKDSQGNPIERRWRKRI